MNEDLSYVGANGQTVNEGNTSIFGIVNKISGYILTFAWIVLLIMYYVFYIRGDTPDLFHLADTSRFEKAYNVAILKQNFKEICDAVEVFLDSIPRF